MSRTEHEKGGPAFARPPYCFTGYEKELTFFVAITAFGRAFAAFSVALFAQGVSFVFVEFDFARFSVAVADFAIFEVILVSFVVEGDVAVFSFDRHDVGGKGGAGGESDEHGGNNKVFHGSFSCLLVNYMAVNSAVEKNIAGMGEITLDIDRNSIRCLPTFI